jgi:hypothetical protein
MSESVSLRDVPGRFLDQRKWRALREFTSQELVALTYLNAPYPDEENPENFFWDGSGLAEDAIRCYHTGRSLLQQCRQFLNAGRLVASGAAQEGLYPQVNGSTFGRCLRRTRLPGRIKSLMISKFFKRNAGIHLTRHYLPNASLG